MIGLDFFKRDFLLHGDKHLLTAGEALSSGIWIKGEAVRRFEHQWAEYCGTKYSLGVGNGLDAIELGLQALGIGDGDEVITTAMTAFATTLAIINRGAIPIFADIDPETCCINVESIGKCLTKRTKAVLAVHLYGRPLEVDDISAFCRSNSIEFIEDCAQSHGSKSQGVPVGSFGTFSAWSFYPTKNLGALGGDAGALCSNNKELIEKCRALSNYGQDRQYEHNLRGRNSRLDEIHASILCQRLGNLNEWISTRRSIAARYRNEIRNTQITLLRDEEPNTFHSYHQFVVKCPRRDKLKSHLERNGIFSVIHYPIPCHQQKALGINSDVLVRLPNTERHAAECLSLPIHHMMREDEVEIVIRACNSFEANDL